MAHEPKLSQRIVRRWKTAGSMSLERVFNDWCESVINQAVPWIQKDLPDSEKFSNMPVPEMGYQLFVPFKGTRGYDTAQIQLVGDKLVISVEANPTGGKTYTESFTVSVAKAPQWIAQAMAIQLVKCHNKAWINPPYPAL